MMAKIDLPKQETKSIFTRDETKHMATKAFQEEPAVPAEEPEVNEPLEEIEELGEDVEDIGKGKSIAWKNAYMVKQIHDKVDPADRINRDNKGRLIKDDEYGLYDVTMDGEWVRKDEYRPMMKKKLIANVQNVLHIMNENLTPKKKGDGASD
jgi:hypothetical protein